MSNTDDNWYCVAWPKRHKRLALKGKRSVADWLIKPGGALLTQVPVPWDTGTAEDRILEDKMAVRLWLEDPLHNYLSLYCADIYPMSAPGEQE